MVHVKKVEIFGFKSFGFSNTVVNFQPGLVSICGPNGSGKSNILDAIIFALGENRPKVMRADKLHSLMHSTGGQHRGPKLARVHVTFDNSDRKIPVDSDTVDVTRELDAAGDNTYYLNKKQTKRSQILDLLEVANAGLHQLNVVQQGTVTRISGFTSEEKRETIEDLIGLSYFDEKKTEAMKTLNAADQKLEVALAKMGEVKQRIDELEEERNQKLRYDMLGGEIARLEGIMAAARLDEIRQDSESIRLKLGTLESSLDTLGREQDSVRSQIADTDTEKAEFMAKEEKYKLAKKSIESDLSEAQRLYGEAESRIATSNKRLSRIAERIPQLDESIKGLDGRRDKARSEAVRMQEKADAIRKSRSDVTGRLHVIDEEASSLRSRQSTLAKKKIEADNMTGTLTRDLNSYKLRLGSLDSELERTQKNQELTKSNLSQYEIQSEKFSHLLSQYERRIQKHRASIGTLDSEYDTREAGRAKIMADIDDINTILEKAVRAATQYEAKIRTVKGIMHEDYTIAQLHDHRQELGIEGLVYQMISWDARYERAALAAGADWIKAFVVPDFATLLTLAEVARNKGLPKLKIIPLDAMPGAGAAPPDAGIMPGMSGMLSDHIKSDPRHSGMVQFLFGNVILADSAEAAYDISLEGYRAVTLDGELFEARAGAAVVDISSKISKLTKIITMSSSVEGLQKSISLLKRYLVRARRRLKGMEEEMSSLRDRKALSGTELASVTQSRSDLLIKASDISERLERYADQIRRYSAKQESLDADILHVKSRIDSIEGRIREIASGYDPKEPAMLADRLAELNDKKSVLEAEQTRILAEDGECSSALGTLSAETTRVQKEAESSQNEMASLVTEREELEEVLRRSTGEMQEYHSRLVALRQDEQDLIETSGTSVSVLREYDDRLRTLNDQDRSLEKRISEDTRQSERLSDSLVALTAESKSLKPMIAPGTISDGGAFEVDPLLSQLRAERDSLTTLNAKAPEAYLIHSDGYRSMSSRKNSLEKERNRIVKFIDDIEKDKKGTFLEAFDKVDKEIRQMFSSMTGGNAWLELQDEDDIFSSGISYLIQFPNKQKRESMSISGGEQTLAAVVFVLALQRLKPSPFYLFDELDAALDAENAKRLSVILAERSEQSQFIVVSHKESVVQKANLIYGVFPKNDASNVVLYKDRRIPKAA